MVLAEPVVDARIAAWLLTPDAPEVTDTDGKVVLRKHEIPWNLEGLLKRRAGEEAAKAAVAALQKVSGMTGPHHSSLQVTFTWDAVVTLSWDVVVLI